MDEVDLLAYRIMDAFEYITELNLLWIMMPDNLDLPEATVDFEVEADDDLHSRKSLERGLKVRGEASLRLTSLRGAGDEELRGLLRRELLEGEQLRKAVITARVIGVAASGNLPVPRHVELN